MIASLVQQVSELTQKVIYLTKDKDVDKDKFKEKPTFSEPAPKVHHKDIDKPMKYSGDKWAPGSPTSGASSSELILFGKSS